MRVSCTISRGRDSHLVFISIVLLSSIDGTVGVMRY